MSGPDKRLAPGFRQVYAFDPDECYERDEQGNVIEETSYVTLDLGAVEPTLVPSSSTYRLIVRGHYPPYPLGEDSSSVGPRYADPISSALRHNISGFTPVAARNRAPLLGRQRSVSPDHPYMYA